MGASVSQVGIHLNSNMSTGHTTHTGVCRARQPPDNKLQYEHLSSQGDISHQWWWKIEARSLCRCQSKFTFSYLEPSNGISALFFTYFNSWLQNIVNILEQLLTATLHKLQLLVSLKWLIQRRSQNHVLRCRKRGLSLPSRVHQEGYSPCSPRASALVSHSTHTS